MYIPEGFLESQIWIFFYILMAILWFVGLKKIFHNLNLQYISILLVASAFSFALMMFKIPLTGGTTGHLIGAAFLSIILGPWASFVVITLSLALQMLVFGDGGITSFAANSFTMGFVASFSGYYMYKYISKYVYKDTSIAAAIGGYFSLICTSAITGIILGAQPIISAISTDMPLHFPNTLLVSICALIIENFIVFGWVEGLFTGIAINFLKSEKSPLMRLGKN